MIQEHLTEIFDHFKKEYPREITIVIQNQFWDLEVDKKKFNVTLSFNRKKETLIIPFESISKFNDPFVKFSLQLEFRSKDLKFKSTKIKSVKKSKSSLKNLKSSNKIIALDKFRKKKD